MFRLYKTWLVMLMRRPVSIFWILFFPIILVTLFNMTMSNANSFNKFKDKVKIEIINSDNEMSNSMTSVLNNNNNKLSDYYEFSYSNDLNTSTSKLNNKDIDGILQVNKNSDNSYELNVTYGKDSFNNSMIKSLIDGMKDSMNINYSIAVNNMGKVSPSDNSNFITNLFSEEHTVNSSSLAAVYTYPLIIFAILQIGRIIIYCIRNINSNMSYIGGRIEMSKVSKFKLLLSAICAIYTIGIVLVSLLIIYIEYVLKMNIGILKHPLELFVNVSVGIFVSICFCSLVCVCYSKKGLAFVESFTTFLTMILYFLAGGMINNLSVVIKHGVPALYYLNFATLISDNLKFINYATNFSIFWNNICISILIGLVLLILTIFIQRRNKSELY